MMLPERMNLKKMSEYDTAATTNTINDSRKRFRGGKAKVASMADVNKEVFAKLKTPKVSAEEITLPRRYTVASLSIIFFNILANRIEEGCISINEVKDIGRVKGVAQIQILNDKNKKQMEKIIPLNKEPSNKNYRIKELNKIILDSNAGNKRNFNFKLETHKLVNGLYIK